MSDGDRRAAERRSQDDPFELQRLRVERCRAGECCACRDEDAPVFRIFQERMYQRASSRGGAIVLQITLEVVEGSDRLVCEQGEWLRSRPWVLRNTTAESERERIGDYVRDRRLFPTALPLEELDAVALRTADLLAQAAHRMGISAADALEAMRNLQRDV